MMSRKNIVTICLFWVLSTTGAQAQNVFPSFADLAEKLVPSVVKISLMKKKNSIAILRQTSTVFLMRRFLTKFL